MSKVLCLPVVRCRRSIAFSTRSWENPRSSQRKRKTARSSGDFEAGTASVDTGGFAKKLRIAPIVSGNAADTSAGAPSRDFHSRIRFTAVFGPIPFTPSLKSVPTRIATSIS